MLNPVRVEDHSDYEKMQLEDLLALAQQGNEAVVEYLLGENIDIVFAKSKLFYIKGLDKDDVIQEGLVGLYKAIMDYEPDKKASFRGFAHLCVNRQLISAIKAANRQKHKPLNNSTSIDRNLRYSQNDGGKGRNLLDVLPDRETDPERDFINKEFVHEILRELKHRLTQLEWKVFMGHLESKSYKEISRELNSNVKTVDNALQRSRRKIEQLRYKLEDDPFKL